VTEFQHGSDRRGAGRNTRGRVCSPITAHYGFVTVNVTVRVVLPLPLVVLLRNTVAVRVPGLSRSALELIDTVTVVLADGDNVPPVAERLIQFLSVLAVQLIDCSPVFVKV